MSGQSVVGYSLIAVGVVHIFLQADWKGLPWQLWVFGFVGIGAVMVWTDRRKMETEDAVDVLGDADGD